MLEVKNLEVSYGDVQVLWDVSFKVEPETITVVLGPNGAGKTTTVKTIAGLLKPKAGNITFEGEDITSKKPYQIIEKGIGLVPEGRLLFPRLTVKENLLMGAYIKRAREKLDETLEWVYEIFPILKERSKQKAGTLSGGEQQMLAIGRSLMSRPKLLMLDEPSLGLAPILVTKVFEIVERLRSEGVTILLVEQNVRHALELADMAYVLETGRIIMEGKAKELLHDDYIKKAYLGM